LTIVDDYSRVVWIYLLIDRKEVASNLKMFFSMVERRSNKQVKLVKIDNEMKFTCMKNYFLENNILFQTSCTGTPPQQKWVDGT